MKFSRKKMFLLAVISILLFGFIWGAVYLKSVSDYKRMVKGTTFEEINISEIPDGVYIGEYDVNFIYAKVEVVLQGGEITDISLLEHRHERGKPAEAIIGRIAGEQRIDVDAVSGATNSSTVIKKAVENALKGGQ